MGELDIQTRGRPWGALVLNGGGSGSSFYTARSVMSRLGILLFLFLVLLVSCIIVRLPTDSFDLFGRGRGGGRRGGSGGSIDLRSFLPLFLYRSVVGKRRYHGAMGCEEEAEGEGWMRESCKGWGYG